MLPQPQKEDQFSGLLNILGASNIIVESVGIKQSLIFHAVNKAVILFAVLLFNQSERKQCINLICH
jgi:hypothetical protein